MLDDRNEEISVSMEMDITEESGSNETLPEKRLMVEVIKRAILDWSSGEETLSKPAKDWFLYQEVEEPDLFSFQFICNMLDLDSKKLRNSIRLYVKKITKKKVDVNF